MLFPDSENKKLVGPGLKLCIGPNTFCPFSGKIDDPTCQNYQTLGQAGVKALRPVKKVRPSDLSQRPEKTTDPLKYIDQGLGFAVLQTFPPSQFQM